MNETRKEKNEREARSADVLKQLGQIRREVLAAAAVFDPVDEVPGTDPREL